MLIINTVVQTQVVWADRLTGGYGIHNKELRFNMVTSWH